GGRFRHWGERRRAGSGRRRGTGAAIRRSVPNAQSARSSSDLPFSGWPGTGILLCSVISAAPSRDKPTLDELDAQQHDEQDPESARSRGELLEAAHLERANGGGHRPRHRTDHGQSEGPLELAGGGKSALDLSKRERSPATGPDADDEHSEQQ